MIEKVYIEYLVLESRNNESYLYELIKIIQPKVLKFARSMISNLGLAEDATQDSLISIVKGLSKLKDPRRFHAWIYQITLNKCNDIFRKSKDKLNVNILDIDEVEELSNATSKLDLEIDMIKLIQQLSKVEQIVIHLFYYEGFTVVEMADILTKPAGTIKSLLFNAREKIKQTYGE
jgi:RNA polymerase sigma-70 factor (ECF subfamily)